MSGQERTRRTPRTGEAAIGQRLRAERVRRRLGLRELARRLGVSASLISQIETGKSKPSVSTLALIAGELGLSLDQLLFAAPGPPGRGPRLPDLPADPHTAVRRATAGPEVTPPVQRAGQRSAIDLDAGARWERLTAGPDPDVDFLYCTYEVGGASSSGGTLLRHPGREYGLVIQGRLALTLGFERYELHPGDSVAFDSTIPHLYANDGDVPVHVVSAVVGNRR